jgi:hypothetical protein
VRPASFSRENKIREIDELSELVRRAIQAGFSPPDCERVEQLLLRYGENGAEREVERVRLDILEICGSNVNEVERLVNLAKTDFRDLIVAAEYEQIDGHLVLKPEFAKPKARKDKSPLSISFARWWHSGHRS